MADWWTLPITQGHGENGEQGVDIGTPQGTLLPNILAGVVDRVNCDVPWRCEIDLATTLNGQPFTEGYLHVDQPLVQVGQVVPAGGAIGLSGGQLAGGVNPDSPSVSTGPHTEFDLWQGSTAWQNAIDPTAILRAGPQLGTGGDPCAALPAGPLSEACHAAAAAAGAAGGLLTLPGQVAGNVAGQVAAGVTSGINAGVTTVGHGLADALAVGVQDAQVFVKRQALALFVAAAVVIALFGLTGRGR